MEAVESTVKTQLTLCVCVVMVVVGCYRRARRGVYE